MFLESLTIPFLKLFQYQHWKFCLFCFDFDIFDKFIILSNFDEYIKLSNLMFCQNPVPLHAFNPPQKNTIT